MRPQSIQDLRLDVGKHPFVVRRKGVEVARYSNVRCAAHTVVYGRKGAHVITPNGFTFGMLECHTIIKAINQDNDQLLMQLPVGASL